MSKGVVLPTVVGSKNNCIALDPPITWPYRAIYSPITGFPFQGLDFTWNLHGYPYDSDIVEGTLCHLYVWASIGLYGLAHLPSETFQGHNNPLGHLTVGFGTWRGPRPHVEAFALSYSPVQPFDEVLAW